MTLRALKEVDQSMLDTACVIVPCYTSEEAGKALEILNLTHGSQRFVSEFDPACEEAGNMYIDGVKLVFVGLSKAGTFGKVRQAFHGLSGKLKSKKYKTFILLLAHLSANEVAQTADAAVNGLMVGTYDFGLLKTANGNGNHVTPGLDVITGSHDVSQELKLAEAAALTQMSIYNLVNLPSNHKTPEVLAQWAVASGKSHGYSVEVFDEEALKEKKFEALLAVNRGSEYPARCIVCRYNGASDGPLIALLGKGVTFDTGGVSLKSGDSMHLMKSDMGGAAAALGAVELLARMKAPVRVIACTPCTDNNIGTRAINPGDVIGSYSGKTIEVINTDAEGRLILADALAYVQETYHPDAIVDLATLTGSIIRALGNFCAGLFTNSDALANALISSGNNTGERLWRMPLWEDYADEMKSEIADIKNLSDKPSAGSVTAAKFLEFFIPDHPAWAHLDIAGVAFKANGISKSHVATAFGVRLLYDFVTNYKA